MYIHLFIFSLISGWYNTYNHDSRYKDNSSRAARAVTQKKKSQNNNKKDNKENIHSEQLSAKKNNSSERSLLFEHLTWFCRVASVLEE